MEHTAVRRSAGAVAAALLAIAATGLAAAPASAAAQEPDARASCVALVFVPQALDDPAAFVAKIAEVKAIAASEGTRNFGSAIGGALGGPGLAHWDCSHEQ
jgi:predicted MFS family arabinose efflux permease